MSQVKRFRADHRHVVETEFDDAQFVSVADYDALQQRLTVAEQLLNDLAPIGRLIASQSNRSTANPMFAVLEKRETITLDTHHHDRIVWVRKDDGSVEADERTHERLELLYEDGREPKEWDRYAMLETDVFVTACFTEQGCKDYLACNGHNLRMPFIYAFGSYRNAEYNLIRDALIGISALNPSAASAPIDDQWEK